MIDVILLRGAPGTGKTTAGRFLASSFPHGVTIEVDLVRWMINSATWKEDGLEHWNALDASRELMLAYLRSEYRPVVFIDNMGDQAVTSLIEVLKDYKHHLFALVARDEVLRKRLELRKGGFRDVATCLAMSRAITRANMLGETTIDTSDLEANEVGPALLASINAVCLNLGSSATR
jgi:predicted kinase